MIAPLIHLLAVSLSLPEYANAKLVGLWPKGMQFDVYGSIFALDEIWKAMGVSIYITVVGTLVTLLLCSLLAYTLTRPKMPGRTIILKLIVVTFVFPVPLIPSYLLVKQLGMINSLWSLIIPGAMSAFYVLIIRTFFKALPGELFEAGKMDGCGELRIYTRIVLPLSMPVLATITLFHTVSQWNSYFSATIYIRSRDLYPLQVLLRNLIVDNGANTGMSDFQLSTQFTPEMMKAGIVLVATLPILIVYPLLQKHFVKGAMLGSVKE
ncbi:carbohydrate ABC transporter permease [Paenibacillus sp. CGMCC 1.16610]|uniref:ABC transporter permease subunit n=1 Tax=Paenibacillus anseongense TaxID=2682845 RepID=A0ABW9U191_9BACL|nr:MULTISPECIES: carbohydrate ABC transporter permease [Paenibacillus]MBA2943285.1 carbohydrate ABC transporter permease [Paenibacillus sp. CGMCC 1.16610]MVQ33783.1 ABC transporter permease subunit [Paenibacillus anseongense]